MTFSVAKDVIFFALAIYGAVLSTWNLTKAIRNDRRAVRVTVGSKMPMGIGGPMEGTAWAHIEATNVGQRPVTITTLVFEFEGGRRLFSVNQARVPGMENTDLPVTLADGQTARLHHAYSEIGRAIIEHNMPRKSRITAVCVDSAGGTIAARLGTLTLKSLCGCESVGGRSVELRRQRPFRDSKAGD